MPTRDQIGFPPPELPLGGDLRCAAPFVVSAQVSAGVRVAFNHPHFREACRRIA